MEKISTNDGENDDSIFRRQQEIGIASFLAHSLSQAFSRVATPMNPVTKPRSPNTPDEAPPSSIAVIVADDQAVARLGTCQLLQEAPEIEVEATAASQSEALRLIRAHHPDLLVTEAKLPDGLGTEIPIQLRASEVQTDVLILSAYRQQAYLQSFLEAGAAGYLLKEDDCRLLVDAIRGIKEGDRGWFSRSVTSQLLTLRNTGSGTDGDALTSRESELLKILAQGLTNREIAAQLELSVGTVKNYLTDIYEKLDVTGRAKAIVWAHNHGITA